MNLSIKLLKTCFLFLFFSPHFNSFDLWPGFEDDAIFLSRRESSSQNKCSSRKQSLFQWPEIKDSGSVVGNHSISGKWTNNISFTFTVLYLWVLFGFTWRSDQSSLVIILPLFPSVLGNAIFSHSNDGWRKMFYFVLFMEKYVIYMCVCIHIYHRGSKVNYIKCIA